MYQQIWKDVRDYEGLYQCSNLGRVKRIVGFHYRKERILKLDKTKKGYICVHLYKKGKMKCKLIHRLVFEAFYRRLLPNEDCHHINEVRDCNVSTNLVAKDEHEHARDHNIGNKNHLGHKHSEQTKQRYSLMRKGRKQSPESIAKMLETRKRNKLLKATQ